MASVNYLKCKAGTGAAGALLRHCDARERLKHDHSNEHIDKERTTGNRQHELSYSQTMAKIRTRLAELDTAPGANKRKDRVELFMLEAPCPAEYDAQQFAKIAVREITAMYGERNVMGWYLHVDEIHEYHDHGQIRTSLAHIHVPVIPEVNGRLNGKVFSSRANMVALNARIHETCLRELGGPGFLTGEHPRQRSVEELKIESYKSLQEAVEQKGVELQQAHRDAQEARRDALALERDNITLKHEKRVLEANNASLRTSVHEIDTALTAARSAAQDRKPRKRLLRPAVVEVPPEEWDAVKQRAVLNNELGTLDLLDEALDLKRMAEDIQKAAQSESQLMLQSAREQSRLMLTDAQRQRDEITQLSAAAQLARVRKDFPEVDQCFDSRGMYHSPHEQHSQDHDRNKGRSR